MLRLCPVRTWAHERLWDAQARIALGPVGPGEGRWLLAEYHAGSSESTVTSHLVTIPGKDHLSMSNYVLLMSSHCHPTVTLSYCIHWVLLKLSMEPLCPLRSWTNGRWLVTESIESQCCDAVWRRLYLLGPRFPRVGPSGHRGLLLLPRGPGTVSPSRRAGLLPAVRIIWSNVYPGH